MDVPEILQKYITKTMWGKHTLNLSKCYMSSEEVKVLAIWQGTTLILRDSTKSGRDNLFNISKWVKEITKWRGNYLDLSLNSIGYEGSQAIALWKGYTLSLPNLPSLPNLVEEVHLKYHTNTLQLDDT